MIDYEAGDKAVNRLWLDNDYLNSVIKAETARRIGRAYLDAALGNEPLYRLNSDGSREAQAFINAMTRHDWLVQVDD